MQRHICAKSSKGGRSKCHWIGSLLKLHKKKNKVTFIYLWKPSWLVWGRQERGGLLCRTTFTITNGITAIHWLNGFFLFHVTLARKLSNDTPPFEDFAEMWHCVLIKRIYHLHCYSLIQVVFSTKFCTVSHILHISLISFEVRDSSAFFSSSSADKMQI